MWRCGLLCLVVALGVAHLPIAWDDAADVAHARSRRRAGRRGAKPPPRATEGQRLGLTQPKPEATDAGARDWFDRVRAAGLGYLDSVRHWPSESYSRVVLDLKKSTRYTVSHLDEPPRLVLDLQKTVVHPPKRTIQVADGVIKAVRAAQRTEDVVRVVLDLEDEFEAKHFFLPDGPRIVVDVFRRESPRPPPSAEGELSLARQFGLKVRTIVLDPGHGGDDPGASRRGLREKDLALDITLRLRDLIRKKERYEVSLTREDDTFIRLEARTAFANQVEADLFCSIHVNAARSPVLNGVETYYLSLATDDESRAVAAFENRMGKRTVGEMERILGDFLKMANVPESRRLAGRVQDRLVAATGARSLGVKRAPFVVLVGARMPAILVEVGFISHKKENDRLGSKQYRQTIAKAIYEGLDEYAQSVNLAERR